MEHGSTTVDRARRMRPFRVVGVQGLRFRVSKYRNAEVGQRDTRQRWLRGHGPYCVLTLLCLLTEVPTLKLHQDRI